MTATADRHPGKAYVSALFDEIAGCYDRVNDLMTLGRHRAWKAEVIRRCGVRPGGRALDLCTGTGDLAQGLAQVVGPSGEVVAVDGSDAMLALARRRSGASRVAWLRADALGLPFGDATFDCVTIGFGLRNLTALEPGLAEIRRVLRPGGLAVSLDLSKPRQGTLAYLVRNYEFHVVPRLAALVGAPVDPYRYLATSNLAFPDRTGLAEYFGQAGLVEVGSVDRGLGAVAIVWGAAPRS